jgi:DNA repair protein RadC
MTLGFSDAAGWAGFAPAPAIAKAAPGPSQTDAPSHVAQFQAGPAFKSTGPHGHRGRMRDRMLDRGAAALADYEILEMLLFLGIRYRDTKPLAKATINHFGTLAAVLCAPKAILRDTPGLTAECAEAVALVRHAARCLAAAEPREAPVIRDAESLRAYLASAAPAALRILYLDSKNRLLADEAHDMPAVVPAAILRRALELHGVSLLLAASRDDARSTRADRESLRELRSNGAAVAVGVHDYVLVSNGEPVSVDR